MKNYQFPIVIERDKDGYFTFCPALQGCYSQGDTYEEALENIQDAIKLFTQDISENKEEMPDINSVSLSSVTVVV